MTARSARRLTMLAAVAVSIVTLGLLLPLGASAETISSSQFGELDCNGDSPLQQSVKLTMFCTDIRGFAGVNNNNTWNGRFYDNGQYIGHDEPDMTFLSSQPGSGNNVTWIETLPRDPSAPPGDRHPGSDVSHWFELSPAPWFSMAMCDPNSYPQTPCIPESDANAPAADCLGAVPCTTGVGGGSAFMEMQFYPPGYAPPWVGISCDDTHWCGALTIDALECTEGFATCNNNCIEPVNFALISTDGVPAGPPNPQEFDAATVTPNRHTLLMNPGDRLVVSMFDAPVPGESGQKAFEVVVRDLTSGQTGFMQASAKNGFGDTSMADCSGHPFNWQPEYNTAQRDNIVPWAALQTDISTEYETGHFEPCTSVTGEETIPFPPPPHGVTLTTWQYCHGPYEDAAGPDQSTIEPTDAPCYPAGWTNGPDFNTAPIVTTGCLDELTQNGDLDFDGSPYWPEWPTGTNPTRYPSTFVQSLPVTNFGQQYKQFFIQTDLALSESTCTASGAGCAVPPPNAPGHFYPYWSRTEQRNSDRASDRGQNQCAIEFGNVDRGVNDFGGDAQYGTDQQATYGYPEFIGPTMDNTCGDLQPHRRS
jgi:hypothetical protein